MLLLQFSTSHYCRKARLALSYKRIPYQVEDLTPGLHIFRVKPLSGRKTVPVLLPQQKNCPAVVADSTEIIRFIESYQPNPPLYLEDDLQQKEALKLEDYFDESIGTAARFVYYQFRAHEGKYIDPSWMSQFVIATVRLEYGINAVSAKLAAQRIDEAITLLSKFWLDGYLVGNRLSVADLAAAALMAPLGLIPVYRRDYPWLFERITEIHQLCHEPLPKNWEAGLR